MTRRPFVRVSSIHAAIVVGGRVGVPVRIFAIGTRRPRDNCASSVETILPTRIIVEQTTTIIHVRGVFDNLEKRDEGETRTTTTATVIVVVVVFQHSSRSRFSDAPTYDGYVDGRLHYDDVIRTYHRPTRTSDEAARELAA
ncbi:hypothetical protein Trydic_g23144 [Trypoxylus dichotomus]